MKILVLGGNGFIGSHLVDVLIEKGHKVRVFDRFPEKYRQPLGQVDYCFSSFEDNFALVEALEGIDLVYHLISTTVPSNSNLNPIGDIESNLHPSVRLLKGMIHCKVKRIIFLSSGGTVYGNPLKIPISESHPLQPLCSYGVVKVAIEHYLQMFQRLHNIQPLIFRVSNPFGPRQGHLGVQGIIATFLSNIIKEEYLNVWGNGSISRDYIYISDLIRLLAVAAESDETGIFNVGSGKSTEINEIIQTICRVTGKNPVVRYEPSRDFDVQKIVLDICKVRQRFDWYPRVEMDEGINLHWNWFNQIRK